MQVQQLPNGDMMHLHAGGYSIMPNWSNPNLLNQQTAMYNANAALAGQQAQANATVQAAQAQASGQQAMAAAQGAQAAAAPYAAYAPAAANMYGSYADLLKGGVGTFGQMFDSYSKAFQGYGNAIGNIAGNAAMAQANANADRYASYSQGATGYQNMLGALGVGALGAYGSAANAAMQAQAMRETAAMKMMSDAVASNQAATASYGGQQAAAQAALAAAYANAGAGLAMGRGNIANAAGNLGGASSTAFANLGGSLANAAGNASTGYSQGQAALRGSIANALSGLTVGQQNALAQNSAGANTGIAGLANAAANAQGTLGAASSSLGTGLGNNYSALAGNSMNYTRDLAKLDLARLLGVGQLNVAGSTASSLGGMGGGLSISGPQGQIASGSFGGGGAGGGGGGGGPPVYMQPTPGWYSTPQYYDAGGMSALNSMRDTGYGALGMLASDSRNATAAGLGQIGGNFNNSLSSINSASDAARASTVAQGDAGAEDMQNAYNSAVGQIQEQGSAGRGGILAALQTGSGAIQGQGAALDRDASNTFAGMDSARDMLGSSRILDALTNNYGNSMNSMLGMYYSGRKDPAEMLQTVFNNTQALANPFLSAGRDAYGQFLGNFPKPLEQQPGLFQDPMPYLQALQAGFNPFMSGLDRAMGMQNANVLGTLMTGRNEFNNSFNTLGDQMRWSTGQVRGPGVTTSPYANMQPSPSRPTQQSFYAPNPALMRR